MYNWILFLKHSLQYSIVPKSLYRHDTLDHSQEARGDHTKELGKKKHEEVLRTEQESQCDKWGSLEVSNKVEL